METTELTSADFWLSDHCRVMVNDRDAQAQAEAAMIQPWAESESPLSGHLLFATSGSTGGRKWVALSRAALLASARMVNKHLSASSTDKWLLALPEFHVGGMGILARCYDASCSVVCLDGKWNAQKYHALACSEKITMSSLVPTQLVDLIELGLPAPSSMRAVLIGGGRLEDVIYQRACDLGWPIMETYGMTETSSQVATAELGSRHLKILPDWHASVSEGGKLSLRGAPLLSGYVSCIDERCEFTRTMKDQWFVTGDIVELNEDTLVVKGRSDRCVKILGELVNLAEVETAIMDSANEASSKDFAVTVIPDTRSGHQLVVCCESACSMEDAVARYNAQCLPVARVKSIITLGKLPRSPLGKVLHAQLAGLISAKMR